MKIEKIELRHYHIPLRIPIRVSFGVLTHRDGLYVTLYAGGLKGWGECPVVDGYDYETVQTAWHIAKDFLIPRLLGAQFDEPEELATFMSHVRGHPFAKSMFDMAAWDLASQRDGLSFAQKLAQPYSEGPKARVKTGISIGIQPSPQALNEVVAGYLKSGYERIKLKIKPGHDLEFVRSVRAAFPAIPLMLDANSAYTLADAPVFQSMEDLNLLMVEQPLGSDDLYEHSLLKQKIKVPMCLDESIHSFADMQLAIHIQALDILNLKPPRVGGWTNGRLIHDLCRANGIPVWIGGMIETELGTAGKVALAALPGVTLPSDIAESGERFEIQVAEPLKLNPEDSTITVPTAPGLGVEIDSHAIEKITLREEKFP